MSELDATRGDAGAPLSERSRLPFPSRRAAERAAVLAFATGVLAVTGTFGLRTAVFQPEYFADPEQLGFLAVHGTAEGLVALLLGFVVLRPNRYGVSRFLLVFVAIALSLLKSFFLLMMLSLGEPEPWTYSLGLYALCGVVTLPLYLSFLPVASAVLRARQSLAHDGPIQIRAALCVWLAAAGLSSLVLGPDLAVRAWGLIVLGGAAMHFGLGKTEERRLSEWVRGALTQGPPAYFVEQEAPRDDVPSAYADEARKAAILIAAEDAGSYRRDPSKRAVAAVDPEAASRPRDFGERVTRIAGIPVVLTLIAIAIGALAMHVPDLPPRAVSIAFDHYVVRPYRAFSIDGLSLWTVERGGQYLVGYDPETRRVVEGEELLRRVRGVPVERLAELANMMLYNGYCCVLQGSDPGWPQDVDGVQPRAPYVQDGKLVFWRRTDGKIYRFEAPVADGMTAPR